MTQRLGDCNCQWSALIMMALMLPRTGRQNQKYENGCRLIAGCIPYRLRDDKIINGKCDEPRLEVLVVKAQKGDSVLFPKGGWETDESVEEAAQREAMEEAGVEGVMGKQLGTWTFNSKGRDDGYRVAYIFPLQVTKLQDNWPENHRERKWMSVEDARKDCKHPWMACALDQLLMKYTRSMNSIRCLGLREA